MNKKTLLLSILAVLMIFALASCGGAEEKVLHLYTWSEYIDPDIYAQFEEETGIRVVEDIFGSNEDLYAKMIAGTTGYDVIVPSDYMVAQMIEEDMIATIDHSRLENLGNLDPTFTNPPFDPGMKYCIPYFWGTTGIGFNWEDWDEAPDSWAYIFDPELAANYSGQISLLDDVREVFGAALIYLGYSAGTENEAELAEARDLVLGMKEHMYSFESDTYEDLMLTGETRLAQGWSGDIFVAQGEDENIDYIIPKEGAVMWVDNLCVTKDAAADPDRMDMVYQWIDYLNRPEINGQNTNWVWYASPNAAARDFIDPEILEYPAIYPDDETFERLQYLGTVGDATEVYSRMWTEIKTKQGHKSYDFRFELI